MNNRGSVLLLVLIIVATIVGTITMVAERAATRYALSESIFVDNQAAYYFHSALKVVKRIIEEDNNAYDSPKDDWASLPPIEMEGATMYVKVFPLNQKINLNLLASKNTKLEKRVSEAIHALLQDQNMPEDTLEYVKEKVEKKPLYSLKELYFAEDVKTWYTKLHRYLTVDDPTGKININFASDYVINTYVPELSPCTEEIISRRKNDPFKNITQMRELGCISDEDYLKVQPFISTSSDYFGVEIQISIGDNSRHATAVLKRVAPGKVEVVKYFEGKGFYE